MSRPPRRPLLVALALLFALTLAACGDSHTKVTTGTYAGESGANAPYHIDIYRMGYYPTSTSARSSTRSSSLGS